MFARVAAWVHKHAGLLAEVDLGRQPDGAGPWRTHDNLSAVTDMLATAMQCSSPQLPLKAFSTECVRNRSLLAVLPADLLSLGSDSCRVQVCNAAITYGAVAACIA